MMLSHHLILEAVSISLPLLTSLPQLVTSKPVPVPLSLLHWWKMDSYLQVLKLWYYWQPWQHCHEQNSYSYLWQSIIFLQPKYTPHLETLIMKIKGRFLAARFYYTVNNLSSMFTVNGSTFPIFYLSQPYYISTSIYMYKYIQMPMVM